MSADPLQKELQVRHSPLDELITEPVTREVL